jgi:uncharacterized membrane protein HdeD (DUF308 family)
MVEILARNWGWMLLRGVLAILFGLFALLNPGIALATLVLVFGAYAVADGVLMIVAAVANRDEQPRWVALLIGGILGIAAGVLTFVWPPITVVALLVVIAAWAIVVGLAETAAAIQLRKQLTGEWVLMVAGLASVAFGAFLVARPAAGALAVILWIGAYALVEGILLVALAFRLRRLGTRSGGSHSRSSRRAGVTDARSTSHSRRGKTTSVPVTRSAPAGRPQSTRSRTAPGA